MDVFALSVLAASCDSYALCMHDRLSFVKQGYRA